MRDIYIGRFESQFDDYSIIMVKALADRLAEVCLIMFLSVGLLDLSCTVTVKVISQIFLSFTGGGRPQVFLRALFYAHAGTRVEAQMFHKLAG